MEKSGCGLALLVGRRKRGDKYLHWVSGGGGRRRSGWSRGCDISVSQDISGIRMNLLEVVVVGVVVVVVVAGAVVVAPEPTDFYGSLVYSRA
jgi:hypothetical protein